MNTLSTSLLPRRNHWVGQIVLATSVLPPVVALAASSGDIAHAVFVGRAVERVLFVLFSGLAIFMGFALFWITSRDTSSAEFRAQGIRIKLQRVGPGVLFCALGVIGMAYDIQTQATWKEIQTIVREGVSEKTETRLASSVSGIDASDTAEARQSLRTLNTAIQYIEKSMTTGKAEQPANALLPDLRRLRETYLTKAVTPLEWRSYLEAKTRMQSDPTYRPEKDAKLGKAFASVEKLERLTIDAQ